MPSRRLLVLILLGFASGLPLFLTGSTLKAWMTDEGLSLGTIGLFSFVTLPYSLKVFWAPLVDRYALPGLGRRRGWLLATQAAMALAYRVAMLVSGGLALIVAQAYGWRVTYLGMAFLTVLGMAGT